MPNQFSTSGGGGGALNLSHHCMTERVFYGHYTFEQLMKLKRSKLGEVSNSLSLPFTGNTLKQELAENI